MYDPSGRDDQIVVAIVKKTSISLEDDRKTQQLSATTLLDLMKSPVFLNVVPSTMLILANKSLFHNYSWTSAVMLAMLHLLFNCVSFECLRQLNFFDRSHAVPFSIILKIMFPLAVSDALQAMSVKLNSLGVFVMLKQLTIPFAALGEYYVSEPCECFSPLLLVFLAGIISGVSLLTVHDVSFNFAGSIVGLSAAALNVLGQFSLNIALKTVDVSPLQLRYETTVRGGWLLLFSLLIELYLDPLSVNNTPNLRSNVAFPLLVSCSLAPVVSLSYFFVMKATSPLTYQVLGPLKLVLSMTASFYFFGEDLNVTQAFAICIVMLSLCGYNYVRYYQKS